MGRENERAVRTEVSVKSPYERLPEVEAENERLRGQLRATHGEVIEDLNRWIDRAMRAVAQCVALRAERDDLKKGGQQVLREGVEASNEIDVLRGELEEMAAALEPLKAIADAYDENELDDEARKRWGQNYEHENTTPPEEIELYSGRGGRQLLTLQHCLAARNAMETKS